MVEYQNRKNEWYITRMLNGKIDPSLQVISKIAKILRVSVADLFSKNDGQKKLWDLSDPTMRYCNDYFTTHLFTF